MRRRVNETDEKHLSLPNYYELSVVMGALTAIPLRNPSKYPFDFDLTHTLMSVTVQLKHRGMLNVEHHKPRQMNKIALFDGAYVTTMVMPKNRWKS